MRGNVSVLARLVPRKLGRASGSMGMALTLTSAMLVSIMGPLAVATYLVDPMGVTRSLQASQTVVSLQLAPGYNFISLPLSNYSFTASRLMSSIGKAAKSVTKFDATDQSYLTYDRDLAAFGVPQTDFSVDPDVGYIVYAAEACSLTVQGDLPGSRQISLQPGYNLLGWTSATSPTVTAGLVNPSGEAVQSVSAFDQSRQEYVTYDVALASFGVDQPDFQLSQGRAYFAYSRKRYTIQYDDGTSQTPPTTPALSKWNSIGPGCTDWVMVMTVSKSGVVYAGLDTGGIFKSTDRGQTWFPINNGLSNYYVMSIVIDPNNEDVIYAGTRGGVFKTEDGGRSWSPKRNGIGGPQTWSITASIGALAMDPNNPSILYAGVGEWRGLRYGQGKIYKSTDGGGKWVAYSIGSSSNVVSWIAVDPSNSQNVYAATPEGFFRSTNAGQGWTSSNAGLPHKKVNFVAIDPRSPSTVYVTVATTSGTSFNGGIYKSTDRGQTWFAINSGLSQRVDNGGDQYRWIAIDVSNPQVLYVAEHSYLWDNGVYKSADGGAHWSHATDWRTNVAKGWLGYDGIGPNAGANTIAVDPTNPNRVYFGSTSTMSKSEDGGSTWQQTYTDLVSSSTAAWRSRGIDAFGGVMSVATDPKNPNVIYQGIYDQGFLKSSDGGQSWRRVRSGIPNGFQNVILSIAVNPSTTNTIYAIAHDTKSSTVLLKSTDYGESWQVSGTGLPSGMARSIVIDPTNPSTAYVTVDGYGVYKSTDDGRSWGGLPTTGLPSGKMYRTLAIDPNNPNRLFLGVAQTGLYVSTNGGGSWSRSGTADMADVKFAFVDQRSNAYVVTGHMGEFLPGVFKLPAGTASWSRVLTPQYSSVDFGSAVIADPSNPNAVLASFCDDNYHDEFRGSGIYYSVDGGTTWKQSNNGLAVTTVSCLAIQQSSRRVYAGTRGSGLYFSNLP